jgi:LmbE family N-acetylglucosaminyl deacetylase
MTLVSFHAHPDDEAIATGGVIAAAAAAGHRVVLVYATRGEHGEVPDGFLAPGESLSERREREARAAAEVLGVAHVEFLGYRDSGMAGEPTNDHDGSFWSAPVDDAASRLASILAEEAADILTTYDHNGVYGHPDHIQVNRVGARAAELAGTTAVFEATMNRDHIVALVRENPDFAPPDMDASSADTFDLGLRDDEITTGVDVSDFVELKRRALAAHASQVGPDHFFMTMPDAAYRAAFGMEWFVRRGADPSGPRETSLWDAVR